MQRLDTKQPLHKAILLYSSIVSINNAFNQILAIVFQVNMIFIFPNH